MVRYVVVGGGVAGVVCAEELCRICPQDSVTLVSIDRILKGVSTVAKITKTIEEVKIEEKSLDALPYDNLEWVQGVATGIDHCNSCLLLESQQPLPYDKICICTGASPRRLLDSPHVQVLRDTDSVAQLVGRLRSARKAVVVGNGGIALELAQALHGIDVVWVVKHGHIGDAFFDVDAANFLLEELERIRARNTSEMAVPDVSNGVKGPVVEGYEAMGSIAVPGTANSAAVAVEQGEKSEKKGSRALGHAVGPAWTRLLPHSANAGSFSVELHCKVTSIEDTPTSSSGAPYSGAETTSMAATAAEKEEKPFPLCVALSDGRSIPTDVIISVIGVDPAVDWVPSEVARGNDGGLQVGQDMSTSVPGIYAAGDSCCAAWAERQSPHWFQMRLWPQARSQAVYAAHCMAGVEQEFGTDVAFELFTHVTRFLGKKVVLLGLYNGQRLETEPAEDMVSYSRVMGEGEERTFVRVLLLRGRVQGAIMIGETDLEEVMENLILDGLDVSRYGPGLLDPEVELDHIFD